MIVFDASTILSAALKTNSVPERALLRAEETDISALSAAVDAEIREVLGRSKFCRSLTLRRRDAILNILHVQALWFEPNVRIAECRDPKDDKYLELALAAGADTIVSSDDDLLVLHPWRGIRILHPADYIKVSVQTEGG